MGANELICFGQMQNDVSRSIAQPGKPEAGPV